MSNVFWGVDSLTPASSVVVAAGKKTLFDVVVERSGRVPAFWGRYLNGHGKSNLSKAEAQFIFRESGGATRILPIYVPAKASVSGNRQQGTIDANRACAIAANLNIPPGVFLWGDIEPDWLTSVGWLRGWWEAMFRSMYGGRGGLYEDPRESNGMSFAWPYFDALVEGSDWRDYGQYSSQSTSPGAHAPGTQDTYHQSTRQEKPAPAPKFHRGPPPTPPMDIPAARRLLWSQRPVKVGLEDLKTVPEFKPTIPKRVQNTTVLWQYAIDCMKLGGRIGKVDLDLANAEGLETMWSGVG